MKKNYWVAVVLLLTAAGYFYSSFQPWSPLWLDGKQFWYTLHWKGQRVGYVHTQYELKDDVLQATQITSVSTKNRGHLITLHEKQVFRFDNAKDGELISIFYGHQQDDYFEQISLTKRGDRFVGVKTVGNRRTQLVLSSADYKLEEFLQLMRWSYQYPTIGDRLMHRKFDPKSLDFTPVNYEIISKNIANNTIQVEFQEQGKQWKGFVELSANGTPLRYAVKRRVEQILSTKEEVFSGYQSTDYYQSQIIMLDKPLGDIRTLKSLVLAIKPSVDANITTGIITNNRQYVDSTGVLHILSGDSSAVVQGNDVVEYLVTSDEQELLTSATKATLLSLAKSIVEGSVNVEEKVAKLVTFVAEYIVDSPVIRPISLEEILEQAKGDCTEHSRLFIALARALSIPAREVNGLVYLGDSIGGFGGHVWNEVIINDQWIAVDPTWDLQSLSATHIELSSADDSNIFSNMHFNKRLNFKLKEAVYSN